MKGKYVVVAVVLLIPFCVLFEIAHRQRLATEPLKVSGNRMTSVTLLVRSYAQEHDGAWPPLRLENGAFQLPVHLMPRGFELGPRYGDKTAGPVQAMLLGNINNAKAYTLASMDDIAAEYLYPGYATASEQEMIAVIDALRGGAPTDADIVVEGGRGTLGGTVLYRLRASLQETLVQDGVIGSEQSARLSDIPALIEKPHDGFSWVYFLNGRLARLPYPGPFPMTERVITGLSGAP